LEQKGQKPIVLEDSPATLRKTGSSGEIHFRPNWPTAYWWDFHKMNGGGISDSNSTSL